MGFIPVCRKHYLSFFNQPAAFPGPRRLSPPKPRCLGPAASPGKAAHSRLTTSAGFWAATRQVWNVTVSNVTAATAAKAAANTHQATGVR